MQDIIEFIEILSKDVNNVASHVSETVVQLAENDGKWNEDLHYRLLNHTQTIADNMKYITTVLERLALEVEVLKNSKK